MSTSTLRITYCQHFPGNWFSWLFRINWILVPLHDSNMRSWSLLILVTARPVCWYRWHVRLGLPLPLQLLMQLFLFLHVVQTPTITVFMHSSWLYTVDRVRLIAKVLGSCWVFHTSTHFVQSESTSYPASVPISPCPFHLWWTSFGSNFCFSTWTWCWMTKGCVPDAWSWPWGRAPRLYAVLCRIFQWIPAEPFLSKPRCLEYFTLHSRNLFVMR